jgi:hypothetical protein
MVRNPNYNTTTKGFCCLDCDLDFPSVLQEKKEKKRIAIKRERRGEENKDKEKEEELKKQ